MKKYLLCMGVGAPVASHPWCDGDMAGWWAFSGSISKAGMAVVAVVRSCEAYEAKLVCIQEV